MAPYIEAAGLASWIHAAVTSRLDYCYTLISPQNQFGNPSWWLGYYWELERARIFLWFYGHSIGCSSVARLSLRYWLPHTKPLMVLVTLICRTTCPHMLHHNLLMSAGSWVKSTTAHAVSSSHCIKWDPQQRKHVYGRKHVGTLWNGLSKEVRQAPTLLAFCKLCKNNYSRGIFCKDNRVALYKMV